MSADHFVVKGKGQPRLRCLSGQVKTAGQSGAGSNNSSNNNNNSNTLGRMYAKLSQYLYEEWGRGRGGGDGTPSLLHDVRMADSWRLVTVGVDDVVVGRRGSRG